MLGHLKSGLTSYSLLLKIDSDVEVWVKVYQVSPSTSSLSLTSDKSFAYFFKKSSSSMLALKVSMLDGSIVKTLQAVSLRCSKGSCRFAFNQDESVMFLAVTDASYNARLCKYIEGESTFH